MNIQRKNSAHHFRMQSEREQTLVLFFLLAESLYGARAANVFLGYVTM